MLIKRKTTTAAYIFFQMLVILIEFSNLLCAHGWTGRGASEVFYLLGLRRPDVTDGFFQFLRIKGH